MANPVEIPLLASPEELVRQLQLATVEAILEKGLIDAEPSVLPEIVTKVTNEIVRDPHHDIPSAIERSLGRRVEITEVKIADVLADIRKWAKTNFAAAPEKLPELAQKVIEISNTHGTSVQLLLNKLCRRLLQFLVSASVVPPFCVRGDRGETTLVPDEMSLSMTSKISFPVSALTPAEVTKLLADLLESQATVEVKFKSSQTRE